jgi:hypothetical protein
MNPLRLIIALQGVAATAAIAALIVVLLQAPELSNVNRHLREVKEEVVTLHLPHGVHATTTTRKEVMPGPPGRTHNPGGKPTPARRRRHTDN